MANAKIDLKARLGRHNTGVPAAGASIPPPAGISPSLNPMAGPASAGSIPAPPSGGFGSVRAPAPGGFGTARVEMPMAAAVALPALAVGDEDLAKVSAGGKGKLFAMLGAAALVGVGLGYTIGQLNEQNRVAQLAVAGAKALAGEVEAANKELTKLNETLSAAATKLGGGGFPTEEVKALGAINIPFDGTNLASKPIGRFRPQLVNQLIGYASKSARANDQKDKLRSLLTLSQKGVEELLAQKTDPTVRWGVVVQDGPAGPWASMSVLAEPFSVKASGDKGRWPEELKLTEGKESKSFNRYTGGDPSGDRRREPKVIPVAPGTHGAVCPVDTLVQLRRELAEMQRVIQGDQTPGRETEGIATLGDSIVKQLRKIGDE